MNMDRATYPHIVSVGESSCILEGTHIWNLGLHVCSNRYDQHRSCEYFQSIRQYLENKVGSTQLM